MSDTCQICVGQCLRTVYTVSESCIQCLTGVMQVSHILSCVLTGVCIHMLYTHGRTLFVMYTRVRWCIMCLGAVYGCPRGVLAISCIPVYPHGTDSVYMCPTDVWKRSTHYEQPNSANRNMLSTAASTLNYMYLIFCHSVVEYMYHSAIFSVNHACIDNFIAAENNAEHYLQWNALDFVRYWPPVIQ